MSMREGVGSTREWVKQDYNCPKVGAAWTDVWHMATEIDFKVGKIQSDTELMHVLVTSDDMEMKLRRLASLIYESNHGDAHGAAAMLAVATPGMKKDVAPTWLINEVTAAAKMDHQRAERVGGRGRRPPRGRGRGADADGGGGDQPDGKGGRGRGRRGGRGRGD